MKKDVFFVGPMIAFERAKARKAAIAARLEEFHGNHDQSTHGNWAHGSDDLGDEAGGFSAKERADIVATRRRTTERGTIVSAGSGPVGFVDKILNKGKPGFGRQNLSSEDIAEIISVHGKNIKGQGRAFVVASPKNKGFLDTEPHEIYQAYQRGMGDLMFEGGLSGGIQKIMDTQTPITVEKSPRHRGDSYLYEIPGEKENLLRVSVGSNRNGNRYITTMWVEPVSGFPGGRVDDLEVNNQKFWDAYRKRNGLPEQEYKLIPKYGDRTGPRVSGKNGRYKNGYVVASALDRLVGSGWDLTPMSIEDVQ